MKEIKGIARVKFLPGKVEEWKRLSAEAMEIVQSRTKARFRNSGDTEFRRHNTQFTDTPRAGARRARPGS